MGFWAWFWIWCGLIIVSLAVLGLIGKSLFNRSVEVAHQGARLAGSAAGLLEGLSSKPTLDDSESDVNRPTEEVEAERIALLKQKSKKRAARQRRLIAELKNIDVNESRFTND